jgi:hypothetical protein
MAKPLQKKNIDVEAASVIKAESKAKRRLWKHFRSDKDRLLKALDALSTSVKKIVDGPSAYARFSGAMHLVDNFEDCLPTVEPVLKVLDKHSDCSVRYAAATRRKAKTD